MLGPIGIAFLVGALFGRLLTLWENTGRWFDVPKQPRRKP